MNYLDKIILLLGCIAEIYMVFDYFNNFFECRHFMKKTQYVFIVDTCAVLALFVVNLQENAYVNLIAFPLILWILVSILFETSLGNRLLYFIIAISIIIGCEFLFAALISVPTYFVKETSYIDLSQMAWQLMTMKLLNYLIFVIASQISNKSKKKMTGKIFGMYLCVPIASLGIMLTTYYAGVDFEGNFMLKVMLSLCFALMVLGNILIFYAFNRYSEELYKSMQQNVIITQQSADLRYYTQVQELNDKHSELIHNMCHYLKTIGELAKENRNDNILNIVKELNIELESTETKIYSSNHILNAILSEKYAVAISKGIHFDAYVEPYVDIGNISDSDLIAMLGNLLDNAIRAAEECTENKSIVARIFMQNDGNFCVMKVVNSFSGEIFREEGKFITTKTEEGLHGLGIKSTENIAEKYSGYLECFVEENIFTAILILSAV